MRVHRDGLLAMSILLISVSCQQPPVDTANPLHGVWAVVEIQRTDADGKTETFQPQPGQLIFTRSHYSAVYVPGAGVREPFARRWEPTSEEMLSAFESIIVNSGTYEVSGSRLTVRPIIAKTPEFVGGHQTYEYSVDGDLLSLQSIELESRDGVRLPLNETIRLRRSE